MKVDAIRDAAQVVGLKLRGGLNLNEAERVGALAEFDTVLLLGFVGAEGWGRFAHSPEACDAHPDPLDRWSRRVVKGLAGRFGAAALFPFEGPPYWPFQAWAQRAEPVFPSPLGLLIHPEYGLSHSYRGALAFADPVILEPFADTPAAGNAAETLSPCARCLEKPCLTACPVEAFTPAGYAVDDCARWLASVAGGGCMTGGCKARRACPVGRSHVQAPGQIRFHMSQFLSARSKNTIGR